MNEKIDEKVVAAFDFDCTMTYYDSLVPFLVFSLGWFKTALGLLRVLPGLVFDKLSGQSRAKMKERLLMQFFAGVPMTQLSRWGQDFAEHEIASRLRPQALPRLAWHRSQGHHCVLISASIEAYIEPWGHLVGFDDVLCTRLAVDDKERVTGRILGCNCRGPEKERQLKELIPQPFILYAYGDSDGDRELLAMADHAFYREMPDGQS